MHSESGKSADKRRGRWLDGAEASEDDSASLATESSVPEDELEDLPVAASRGQVQGPVSQAQGARQRDRHMSVRQGSKLLRRQVAFGEGSAGAHLMREADFMSRHAHVEADRGPEQGGTKAGRRWPRLLAFIESKPYFTLVVLTTLFALFIGDMRTLVVPMEGDSAVDGAVFACLCLFSLEMVVLSVAQRGYFLNTFFWLDLIAAFSLIFDITWLYTQSGGGQTDLTLARAGRAARVGSRAGRVARVLRVARLLRVLRLFRVSSGFQRTVNPLGTNFRVRMPRQQSERGSELISRRVVVLVLAVLVAVSFLQVVEVDSSAQAALEQLLAFNGTVITTASIAAQQPAYVAAFDAAVTQYQSTFDDDLLRLRVFGIEYTGSYHPDVLASRRDVELACLVDSATNTTVVLDERDSEVAHSWFSLATIASIVAILIAASYVFSRDLHGLVERPVRRMASACEVSDGLLHVFKVSTVPDADVNQVLQSMVEILCHVLGAARVTLFLIDRTNQQAWGKVSASILDTRKIPNVSREVQEREREVSAMMRGVRVDFDEDETVGTCAKTGETINICDKALLTKPSRVKDLLSRLGTRRAEERGALRGSVLVTAPQSHQRGVLQTMKGPLFRGYAGGAAVAPTESAGSVSAHSTRGTATVPEDAEMGCGQPRKRKLGKGMSIRRGASGGLSGSEAGSFGLRTFAKMPSTRGEMYATSDTPVFEAAQELWRDERLGYREQYELYRLHNVNTMLCVRVNDPGAQNAGLAVLQVANKIGHGDDTLFNKQDEQVLEAFAEQIASTIKNRVLEAEYKAVLGGKGSGNAEVLRTMLAQYTTTGATGQSRSGSDLERDERPGLEEVERKRTPTPTPAPTPAPAQAQASTEEEKGSTAAPESAGTASPAGSLSRKGRLPPLHAGPGISIASLAPPMPERGPGAQGGGSAVYGQDALADDNSIDGSRSAASASAGPSALTNPSYLVGAAGEQAGSALTAAVPWRDLVRRDELRSWAFDPSRFTLKELAVVATAIMDDLGALRRFRVRQVKCRDFAERILDGYNDVPYHNMYHAVSVMHVGYLMLTTTHARESLRSIDVFALGVASIGHDMGHRGFNNGFHISALRTDPYLPSLALTYNDRSVLENLHARNTFAVLGQDDVNITSRLSEANKRLFRELVIGAILATDMTHHFKLTTDLAAKNVFDVEKLEDRKMLVNTVVHSADLANPVLPPERSVALTLRVTQEFKRQAETERQLGLPVTKFMDITGPVVKDSKVVARMNAGFIEFVVTPLWRALHEFFPELDVCMKHIDENLAFWRNAEREGHLYDADGNIVEQAAEDEELEEGSR